jgi:spermidine synthase
MPQQPLPGVTLSEYLGTRYLHLGTPWVQGAMQIRKPNKLVLEYVQRMMAWLLFVPSAQWSDAKRGHAVQLGLGAASLSKYTLNVLGMRTTAIEINREVAIASHVWFELPLPADNSQLNIEVLSAEAWVSARENVAKVSALMVDLYDHEAQAPVLDSPEFYAHCRAVMQPGGAMTVNCFGGDANLPRSLERIAAAFPEVWCFEPTQEGNTVVVAVASDEASSNGPDAATLKLRAASVAAATDLPARKWLRTLKRITP